MAGKDRCSVCLLLLLLSASSSRNASKPGRPVAGPITRPMGVGMMHSTNSILPANWDAAPQFVQSYISARRQAIQTHNRTPITLKE